MDEFQLIDQLLITLESGGIVIITKSTNDSEVDAIFRAEAYGLLIQSGNRYRLTQRGYEVINSGGFKIWEETNQQRENEAHRAVIDSASATVDAAGSAKRSTYAAWFSGVIALVAVGLTFYQIWKGSESDKEFNALKKRVEIIDSLRRVPQPVPKPIKAPKETRKKK
ncbi:hypothetical protein GCM10028805_48130 [Spirosoma harenae]